MSTAVVPRAVPSSPAYRVTYDATLVEEAVLLAERHLRAADAATFRAERNLVYDVHDPDEREARFEALHGRWFIQLGLDRPLHEVLGEFPELLQRTRACRVLPAVCQRDEMADVRAEVGAPVAASLPTIVARLRPQRLLDQEAARDAAPQRAPARGRHARPGLRLPAGAAQRGPGPGRPEPASRALPRPVGRHHRRAPSSWGPPGAKARAARLAEFARAFPMLSEGTETAFAPWFDGPRPSHAAMVAFIQEPRGAQKSH